MTISSPAARNVLLRLLTVFACLLSVARADESPEAARNRHRRVAERRAQVHALCHRGAAEFAHENTLEAYRAALELGADGNEIDIRQTKDGVLICFHDDMLDRLLVAFGDTSDLTWDELQRVPFRESGRWGAACRIPTLAEVLALHRDFAGLLHLDIKRPGLDIAIARLLDEYDVWDHVAYCHYDHGGVLLKDPRLKLLRYKASLYADHGELFPASIQAALAKPGDGLIVDDPRGVLVSLGRRLGQLSQQPVASDWRAPFTVRRPREEAALVAIVRDATDFDQPAAGEAAERASAARIQARAEAADELAQVPELSESARRALVERVEKRSLHRHWMYHGLDGALAVRTLLARQAPGSLDIARAVLWRDDPALTPVVNPEFNNPRSWTDFRLKMLVFPALQRFSSREAAQLCRDYLALSDDAAKQLGPEQFEAAGKALLQISPNRATADELFAHRLQVVRGRAILDCLARSNHSWARDALKQHAPFALEYQVADVPTSR